MATNWGQETETKAVPDQTEANLLTEIIYLRDDKNDDMEGNFTGAVTLVGEVNVHQSPYVTSGNTLSSLMKAKLKAARECFIETRSYDFVKETLEDQGHVLVCGPPGSGKTTLSLVLMDDYRRNHEISFIRTLAELDLLKHIKDKTHALVVFDDIFGQFAPTAASDFLPYRHLFDDFKGYFSSNEGSQKHWLKVLFTTRTDVFHDIAPLIKKYKYSVFKCSTTIDLNSDLPLKPEEKKLIITKHTTKHKIKISQSELDEIANMKFTTLGFPYICELFTQQKQYITTSVREFFKKPLTYLIDLIGELFCFEESCLQAAVLVLIVLNDGRINITNLKDSAKANVLKVERLERVVNNLPSTKQLQKSLYKTSKSMIGTYLTAEGDNLQFSHPTLFDAVACHVGLKDEEFILENCSLRFIVERVKLKDYNDLSTDSWDESDLRIKLGVLFRDKFINRLVTDINEETLSLVFSHSCLRDRETIHGFIAALLGSKMLEKILHMKDKENGRTFLFWAACTGIWKRNFFEIIQHSLDDFHDSELLEACLGSSIVGNEDALEYIIDEADDDLRDKMSQYTIDEVIQGQGRVLPNHMTQPRLPMRHTTGQDLLIHMACIHGQKRLIEKFLDMGVDSNVTGAVGMSPVMYACYFDHLNVVTMLFKEKGADCLLKNEENDNCLHLAVKGGCFDIVKYLLEDVKIDPNVRGRFDRTPLMCAAYDNDVKLVKLLTENNAELEVKQTAINRGNCLPDAAHNGSTNVVRFLLDERQVNINLRSHIGRTSSMMACRRGHTETAKLLLVQPKTDTGSTDYMGANCFHLAVMSGNVKLLKWMKKTFPDSFDVSSSNYKGCTPLISAAQHGRNPIVDFLLAEGVDFSQCDKFGGTCLHYSVSSENLETVQTVLDLDLDLEKTAYNGRTPVMYACQYGNVEIVSLLKSKGANFKVKDKDGLGCLHLACMGGKKDILDMLMKVPELDIAQQDESSLIRLACDGGSLEIVNMLLEKRLKPTPTCLHAACYRGHKNIVDKLLEMGTDSNAKDDWSKTPFMQACEGGSLNIAMMLWERNAQNVNDHDKQWNTCLHLAAKGDNPELLNWIVDKGALLASTNRFNQSALHYAGMYGAAKTAEKLIGLGCSINHMDKDGRTPLLVSLLNNQPKALNCFEILKENSADMTVKDINGDSCLHIAARSDTHIHSADILLNAGMNINVQNNRGNSPIMVAARFGQEKMFTYLLQKGADIRMLNVDRASPIHLACSGKYPSLIIIKKLIGLGLDPCARDRRGRLSAMYIQSDTGYREDIISALSPE